MNFARRSDAVRTTSSVPFRLDSCCPSITRRHSFGFIRRTWTWLAAGNTWGRDAGLHGAMAVTIMASTCGSTIGPPADIEYEVEPGGAATIIPPARIRSTTWWSRQVSKVLLLAIGG